MKKVIAMIFAALIMMILLGYLIIKLKIKQIKILI